MEPPIIAIVLSKKDSHIPNTAPPTTELILLGIGAIITDISCIIKKTI